MIVIMDAEDTAVREVVPDACALTSGVLVSIADNLLRAAIETTLRVEPCERAALFAVQLAAIEARVKEHPEERPWTFSAHSGTDGSSIFRGGTGRSIVVDPAGTLWRARSLEDFDTEYEIANGDCRITSLTPRYDEMHRYELGSTAQH
jgi:hypothetical protein